MTTPQANENNLKQSAKEIITSTVFQGRWGTTDTHDTDTSDKTLTPHEDIMGTKLWDYIQPLSRQVGTILKYIWRAGLHPSETAAHDYKIALINLKELNPNAAIEVPGEFLITHQFKKIYEGGGGLAAFGVGEKKANMLHHYTRMLKQQGTPDSGKAFYQRINHYNSLRKALEEAIEAENSNGTNNTTSSAHHDDILGMGFWDKVRPLPFVEGNVLKSIWQAGMKDGVPTSEDYAKALTYLRMMIPEEKLPLPSEYFYNIPFQTLMSVMHGWESHKIGDSKAYMLYHFFHLLLHKKMTGEFKSVQQRRYHYEALYQELVDVIKASNPAK